MATQSQIRQLQTPDRDINVYPITVTDAVFDEDGVPLPEIIEDKIEPSKTVEGNPVTFSSKYAQPALSTKLTLNPIQDLHGYDHPWAGGAGKNLLPMTVNGLKEANTVGTWSGNSYTLYGITFTVLTDSDENVIGIKANGTASAQSNFILKTNFTLSNVSYNLNGVANIDGTNKWNLRLDRDDVSSHDNVVVVNGKSGVTDKAFTPSTPLQAVIRVYNGVTVDNLMFYPMIRLSSVTDATFEPYTNICPISGRTEVGIEGCGKNLLPMTVESLKAANANRTWTENKVIIDGVEFEILVDTNNNVIGISATRVSTSSSNAIFRIAGQLKLTKLLGRSIKMNGTASVSNNDLYLQFYLYDGVNMIVVNAPNTETRAFTPTKYTAATYVRIVVRAASNPNKAMFKPMIYDASLSMPPFEPYTSSNDLTISLGQTVYGGTVDVEKGELVVDRAFVELSPSYIVDVSSASTTDILGGKRINTSIRDAKYIQNTQTAISNELQWSSNMYSATKSWTVGVANDGKIVIRVAGATTKAEADIYLSSNVVQVCYELATPTVIPLTPAQIHLLKGINNISTDGDKIKLTYKNNPYVWESEIENKADNDTIAPVEKGTTVSQAYSVGQYMMWGGELYKVTANIANGGTITVGTNVTKTTVAAELLAILAQLS